uniref:Uncharacterized protein LOC114324573 isoform X2 n=1 Tax=Diabrotica virgifera virgifera TaxID=50390 RepID=A0A6P7F420_DIAVI
MMLFQVNIYRIKKKETASTDRSERTTKKINKAVVNELLKTVQTDLSGMNIDDLQSKLDSQTREMKVTLSAIEKLYTKNQIAKLSLAMS